MSSARTRLSYVLPDPVSYPSRDEFARHLALIRSTGYEGVELQITEPLAEDGPWLRRVLANAGLPLVAVQTGGSYAKCGNCLATANAAVRQRTVELLKREVDFVHEFGGLIVFGSLQGRTSDEPDRAAGEARILEAVAEVGRHAADKGVVIAFEPVNHLEVGFHNTIAAVQAAIQRLALPSVRIMVDSFHMNIEERDMLAPLAEVRDVLAHVHLAETNRDVLGAGHWPTAAFLAELGRLGYGGFCSIGVYNTCRPRPECIVECMRTLRSTGVAD